MQVQIAKDSVHAKRAYKIHPEDDFEPFGDLLCEHQILADQEPMVVRLTLSLLRAIERENHIRCEASIRREMRSGPDEARKEAERPSYGFTTDGEMRALVGILRNRYM